MTRKLALSLGTAVASVGLFGAVAFAALGPDTAAPTFGTFVPQNAADVAKDGKHDKLKDILDELVTKGVITQAQEDAILAAVKDAAGKHHRGEKEIFASLFSAAAQYLGMTEADLRAKLPGTSLGAIADATPGKNKAGLVNALTFAANIAIDTALNDKKITADEAKELKDALPKRIAEFVDHTWPTKPTGDRVPIRTDLMEAARDYLGLSQQDIMKGLQDGKTLGQIADSTPGKSRAGLVAALEKAANDRIDKAQADGKITADQAKALKDKVADEVTRFVDRTFPGRGVPKH